VGDEGQHRQGILGGDGLQAGLVLLGRGLGLVDQAEGFLDVLELHLGLLRGLGPQSEDHDEDEGHGQHVLFHLDLHRKFMAVL
jgi:hypothetical protein